LGQVSWGQECRSRTAETGQLGKDIQDRTDGESSRDSIARIGNREKDSHNMTARTRHLGQDNPDGTTVAGQLG
jgi:hypothetical protein